MLVEGTWVRGEARGCFGVGGGQVYERMVSRLWPPMADRVGQDDRGGDAECRVGASSSAPAAWSASSTGRRALTLSLGQSSGSAPQTHCVFGTHTTGHYRAARHLGTQTPATMPPPAQGGCCAHNHDCEAADCGPAYSLYKHIDLPRVRDVVAGAPGAMPGRPGDNLGTSCRAAILRSGGN